MSERGAIVTGVGGRPGIGAAVCRALLRDGFSVVAGGWRDYAGMQPHSGEDCSGPPLRGEIAYAASKGAIEWLTLSAAAELAPRGIAVNAVDPGPTDTGWMTAEVAAAIAAQSPSRRVGRPEDAAELLAFLCSERGGWINGQVLRSDGGFSTLR
jgi:NAD(P)-dependent dehydrogenase (short-subunit alcohol dehydrogenase family)